MSAVVRIRTRDPHLDNSILTLFLPGSLYIWAAQPVYSICLSPPSRPKSCVLVARMWHD
jgi:hypothetical protein